MANPQCEDGFLRIAKELVFQLAKLHLTPNEWRVLWAIWSKTWLWNKKEDRVPVSQIVEITGLNQPHASRAKKSLIKKGIITNIGIKSLSINKNYDLWNIPKLVYIPKSVCANTNIGMENIPILRNSKEKKETLQKKPPPYIPPKGDEHRLLELQKHLESFGVCPTDFLPIWVEWVKCKQGKPWKNIAAEKKGITHLMNLCNRDSKLAQKIVDQSIANNWQGLFPLKTDLFSKSKDHQVYTE